MRSHIQVMPPPKGSLQTIRAKGRKGEIIAKLIVQSKNSARRVVSQAQEYYNPRHITLYNDAEHDVIIVHYVINYIVQLSTRSLSFQRITMPRRVLVKK